MQYKIFLILIILILTLLCCSCEQTNDDDIIETTDETVTIISEIIPPPSFPVTVRGVEIAKEPVKIAILPPFLAEITAELEFAGKVILKGEYCDYPPEFYSDIPIAGNVAFPDTEKLITSDVDLILSSEPFSSVDLIALENNGTNVIIIPRPSNINEFKQIYLDITTALAGIKEDGDVQKNFVEKTFKPISDFLNNPDAVNIGSFIFLTENNLVAGGDTFESAILSSFGKNLAADESGYTDIFMKYADSVVTVVYSDDNNILPETLRDDVKKLPLKAKIIKGASGRVKDLKIIAFAP